MMNRCALSAHYEVLGDYVMKEFITSHPELFRHIICVLIMIASVIYILKLEKRNSQYKKLIINGSNNNLNNYQVQNNSVTNSVSYNNLLNEKLLLEQKFNYYQQKVKLNLNNLFTVGELTLIEIFRDMLNRKEYSDWKIYGQIQYKTYNTFRIDFLVVSEKGVFVVESKAWKGLTLIYEPNYSNVLTNSIYNNYGRSTNSRSTEIQVFNINGGANDSLYINEYTNPIEQARNYSRDLRNILNCRIKNLVVFQQDNNYQVKFNDNDLNAVNVDNYTTITTNRGVINYFSTVASEHINTCEINNAIRKNCDYAICLNASNVNEPPWVI